MPAAIDQRQKVRTRGFRLPDPQFTPKPRKGSGALFQHALLLHSLDGLVGQRLLAPGGGIAEAEAEQVEQWLKQGVLISQRCLPGRTAIRVRELKDVGFADDVFRSFLES